MPRITVYHLTRPRRLPLIEEEGLRTRADLSRVLGPPDGLDAVAPGRFAHGKRVSGWYSPDHARGRVAELGAGYVSWSVAAEKTLAAPASLREGAEPREYWEAARPLADWLADGEPPADLEVHQSLPVRAKYVRIHAPLVTEEELGAYAPIVGAVADTDRLSAKALMHLAVIAGDGEFDGPEFLAACALAWRDEPDPDGLVRELVETDPDKVASAALAEYGAVAPDAAQVLREALETTRQWADQNGFEHGQGLFARTSLLLEELPERA